MRQEWSAQGDLPARMAPRLRDRGRTRLPRSAGPGTAGKELLIVLNNFAITGANSINLTAPATDPIIVGSATVCTSGCSNTAFGVDAWVHVVSDGNHHWYCPVNN